MQPIHFAFHENEIISNHYNLNIKVNDHECLESLIINSLLCLNSLPKLTIFQMKLKLDSCTRYGQYLNQNQTSSVFEI